MLTFGILMFFYMSVSSPFEAARQRATSIRTRDVDIKFPSFAHDLNQRFLQHDPSKRIAFADFRQHPCSAAWAS